MTPDDDDAVINQLKSQKAASNVTSKTAMNFLNAANNRPFSKCGRKNVTVDLQSFAEDELVRKEYKELRCEMPGIPRSTFLMVFSPDGTKVASTHGNHNIYVTDLRSGRNLKTLVGHPRTPWCIAFHPTSNQLLASGCLGGQVRIWDLSGGSEVWMAGSQTVIASIAFHPSDRILVIATYNELYFWDWSKPEPLSHIATSNPKEKVRYVAFDKLGHKLITGIANTPQSRWERARCPVPPADVSPPPPANPYRRRIIPRFIEYVPTSVQSFTPSSNTNPDRVPLSSVPERERRIMAYYRNLVHEYELLVHRYLQVYRPPATIDRGTDPMEVENRGTNTTEETGPSTSNWPSPSTSSGLGSSPYNVTRGSILVNITRISQTSTTTVLTSSFSSNSVTSSPVMHYTSSSTSAFKSVGPSANSSHLCGAVPKNAKLLAKRRSSDGDSSGSRQSNRADTKAPRLAPPLTPRVAPAQTPPQGTTEISANSPETSDTVPTSGIASRLNLAPIYDYLNLVASSTSTTTPSSPRRLVVRNTLGTQTTTESPTNRSKSADSSVYQMRIRCSPGSEPSPEPGTSRGKTASYMATNPLPHDEGTEIDLVSITKHLDDMQAVLWNSGNLGTSGQNRAGGIVPSSERSPQQQPSNENPRSSFPIRCKRLYPGFIKKVNRRRVFDTSSDSSSSDEEDAAKKRMFSLPLNPSGAALSREAATTSRSVETTNTASATASTSSETQEVSSSSTTITISSSSSTNSISETSSSVPSSTQPSTSSNNVSGNATHSNCNYNNIKHIVSLAQFILNKFNKDGDSAMQSPANDTTNTDSFCQKCGNNIELSADAAKPSSSATPDVSVASAGVEILKELQSSITGIPSSNAPTDAGTDAPTLLTTGTSVIPTTDSDSAEETNNANLPRRAGGSARTNAEACLRTLMNTVTRTTNSTVYTPSFGPMRRFYSHRMSAFLPTRVQSVRPQARWRRSSGLQLPPVRNRLGNLGMADAGSSSLPLNSAPDEVVNYSERPNSEDDPLDQPASFHPFDPPPEIPSINPENIGIGNMYSNIVQDLESSLNNVRNIRASTRPGETSGMLSSFSERLESIMQQSDSILRNLRNTIDMLPPTTEQMDTNRGAERQAPTRRPIPSPVRSTEGDSPRFMFNDTNFYVRNRTESLGYVGANQHEELHSSRSAVASDHTYPRNHPESPRTIPPTTDNMSPLMTSLHFTILHIQRQASLLRRQVESIERIDRAMVEVAQLQMMRQMFVEMRTYTSSLFVNDSRSAGVSSVRQMMAGTRISDSSPYDSPIEGPSNQNVPSTSRRDTTSTTASNVAGPDGNTSTTNVHSTSNRVTRRCIGVFRLPTHRQNRHMAAVNLLPRRYCPRDRPMRRRVYIGRAFLGRSGASLASTPTRCPDQSYSDSHVDTERLTTMTFRLEGMLTDNITLLGDSSGVPTIPPPHVEGREPIIAERVNGCRQRMNRILGYVNSNRDHRPEITSVTPDGWIRFHPRYYLSLVLNNFSKFFDQNTSGHITHSLRLQIRAVLDLALLLSDIMLLQIVDSIPPPTGMNLDPERESLSTRIDHMCSRMLQRRLGGHSHNLTRSLRLMRLTARYASRALGQTYNARRNAMLSSGSNSRGVLLGQINSTLHNVHGNRLMQAEMSQSVSLPNPEMPMREWYHTINELVTRYHDISNPSETSESSSANNVPAEDVPFRNVLTNYLDDTNSDNDDEPEIYSGTGGSIARGRQLYRTSNMNLVNNDDINAPSTQNRNWNVPTVQINDVPVSEPSSSSWHFRFTPPRYRLSDLRFSTSAGLFRPRFLHPLYSGVNPFDADLDDPQREQIYDGDIITTVTPNHRIQVWDISSGKIPDISNGVKNVVVGECKIHNDASVDISADGTILVTLLPSGGYMNVTNRIGVYSLKWENLGQCLYITSFEQNTVSVSLSPLGRHLVVGLASRRVSIIPNDRWTMARIFLLDENAVQGRLPLLRELEQSRDTSYMSLNCIRWLPVSGQGLIYATNTGQLRILT